jgi:ATP-dependent Clp protease ATP-binding subunit ClpC
MRERYTDRARRVVALVQAEARRLDHDRIGTEHILLGLLQEAEDAAGSALSWLGIGLDEVRRQVGQMPSGGLRIAPSRRLPCTPQARTVLSRAHTGRFVSATTTSAPSTSCSRSPMIAKGVPP